MIVDFRSGDARGFAYCSSQVFYSSAKAGHEFEANYEAMEYFVPGWRQRSTVFFFGDKKIEMPVKGEWLRGPIPTFYERDEYIWKSRGYS